MFGFNDMCDIKVMSKFKEFFSKNFDEICKVVEIDNNCSVDYYSDRIVLGESVDIFDLSIFHDWRECLVEGERDKCFVGDLKGINMGFGVYDYRKS
jgi:hypothetical protein